MQTRCGFYLLYMTLPLCTNIGRDEDEKMREIERESIAKLLETVADFNGLSMQ